ncbi:MAG: hypothetical protein KJI69_06050 [Patescibacteria group bacterium]|nr:hypothetical protein [Patescibacteria group bacterium]
MKEDIKVPKDLGIKIGSKEEVFWTAVKEKMENSILQYTESLIGEKLMLELAEKRIAEEKEKFK